MMEVTSRHNARSRQQQLTYSFIQTIETRDVLLQHENAALRAQVHDLTELLAGFDLCELQDAHLKAIRDRAFQRDVAPDAELLQVYHVELQLQQQALRNALENDETIEHHTAHEMANEGVQGSPSEEKRVIDSLQLRVEVLEREVDSLHLRHDIVLQTSRHGSPVEVVGNQPPRSENGKRPIALAGVKLSTPSQVVEQEGAAHCEELSQEQQQRIAELEQALATELAKNAALEQQCCRYQQMETILDEFSPPR